MSFVVLMHQPQRAPCVAAPVGSSTTEISDATVSRESHSKCSCATTVGTDSSAQSCLSPGDEAKYRKVGDLVEFFKLSQGFPQGWDVSPRFFSEEEISRRLRAPVKDGHYVMNVELPFVHPVKVAELFNALRFNLMEIILFALGSGKQLVEPWILGELRNSSFYEIAFRDPARRSEHDVLFSGAFLYSELFNISVLEDFLHYRIMRHTDYYHMLHGRIELLHTVDPEIIPSMFVVDGRTWVVGRQQSFDTHARLPAFDYKDLHRFIGSDESERVTALHSRRTVLLGDSPNWHDWDGKFYWHIRNAMVFSDAMYGLAARAMIQMNLPMDFKFLSFHWRRGDRGHSQMGSFGSSHMERTGPANVGRVVRTVLEQNGLDIVFVATNVGLQEDWDQFAQAIAPHKAVRFEVSNGADPRKEKFLNNMIVEQIISANAELFLSDGHGFPMGSTVSRIILEERALRYKPYMKKPLYVYSML